MAGKRARSLLTLGPLYREEVHKQRSRWVIGLDASEIFAVILPLRDSAGLVLTERHRLPPLCARAFKQQAHL